MTLPRERGNSVKRTREFLLSLLDKKKTPKVPKAIRDQAYSLLRHYPGDYYLVESALKLPDIWGIYEEDSKKK